MRNRAAILVVVISLALGLAACGRASEEQINQALGITPTPTPSAEQLAAATNAALAEATERAQAAASPAASGDLAALGSVTEGSRQFETWCSGCHTPGGAAPDVKALQAAAAKMSPDDLEALVRDGKNHNPPGPYKTTEISDAQIGDLGAYIATGGQ
ncbi:MAG TPA: cytochrome c [Thermomicrobiales bacterium]|nr:cytochrome c [Thermomicrobiales bacterium]